MQDTAYHLRRSVAADEPFLLKLYAESRAEELAHAGMDAWQREVFVQMQFRVRQAAYNAAHPTALDEIICADSGLPLGRVLTDRTADGMCLIDIAIVAQMQKQGIGARVIEELQQECRAQGCQMRLQVLKGTPAERLYRRLGFRLVAEDALRRQMVWDGTKI